MKDPAPIAAFFTACFICYLVSLIMGYAAKGALEDHDHKACEEIFPIFFAWNFVIGIIFGLSTGALIVVELQVENVLIKTLIMVPTTIIGGVLLVALRIHWRNKLMKRFNHGS